MHEELIMAEPAQFIVYGDGLPDHTEEPTVRGNGLVEARRGAITVFTGAQYDWVSVAVEQTDTTPSAPGQQWTDIVEVSFAVRNGKLRIGTVDLGPKPSSPNFATPGVVDYRIRFAVRGRDEAWAYASSGQGGTEPHVLEYHSLTIWPAPQSAPTVVRLSDATGAAYRPPT